MSPEIVLLPIQNAIYNFFITVSAQLWEIARTAMIQLHLITEIDLWLQSFFFGDAIDGVRLLTAAIVPWFFTIAALLAFSQQMISQIWAVKPANIKKSIFFLVLTLLYLQYGTQFWQEYVTTQRQWATFFMTDMFDALNSAPPGDSPFAEFTAYGTRPEHALLTLTDNRGDGRIDGGDIAYAYLLAAPADLIPDTTSIVDGQQGLPDTFYDTFYPYPQNILLWLTPSMTNDERTRAVALAFVGVVRMFTGYVVVGFSAMESLIWLMLTVSSALWMISLGLALPLSYFERTSRIVESLLELGLQMFLFSIIVGMMVALGTGMVILGAQTANASIALASTFFFAMMMIILIFRSFKFVGQSFNSFIGGASPVVGELKTPEALVVEGAGAVGTVALAAASGGISLAAGATLGQAAGAALGQFDTPYQAAAIGQMALPEGSTKDMAGEFFQGAVLSRAIPLGGAYLVGRSNQPPPETSQSTLAPESAGSAPPPPPAPGHHQFETPGADSVDSNPTITTSVPAGVSGTNDSDNSQAISTPGCI